MSSNMYFQNANRTTKAQQAHGIRVHHSPYSWLPPPLRLYMPSSMHPSIPGFSKPVVCDFPHMQSFCLLHCFVFREGYCLSKHMEIIKPTITHNFSAHYISSEHTRLSLFFFFFFLLYPLCCLLVSFSYSCILTCQALRPTTVTAVDSFIFWRSGDIYQNIYNETRTNTLQYKDKMSLSVHLHGKPFQTVLIHALCH